MESGEKRAHERESVRLDARLRSPSGGELTGTVENLGVLGALVSTRDFDVPFEVGDRVELELEADHGRELQVAGEIVRLEQEFSGGDIRRAFAIRFDEPLDSLP